MDTRNNQNQQILRKIIRDNPLFLNTKEVKDEIVKRSCYHVLVKQGYAYIGADGKHHLTEKGDNLLYWAKVRRESLKIRKAYFPVKKLIHEIKMYFKSHKRK